MTEGGRWLVVGAGGQVGGALCEALGARAVASRRHGTDALDLADPDGLASRAACLVERTGVDVVVVSSAMTDVEACEDDEVTARTVNAAAPRALAAAAAALGVPVVHLSTDYVFDGCGGPYSEDDRPSPLSVYGRTKLEGELAVLDAAGVNLVVRTTVVYGPEAQGRNFAYRLTAELAAGRSVRVPNDQVGTPTYNRDLSTGILAAVAAGRHGVIHVAGSELCDRAAFARRIAGHLGLDTSLVTAVQTAELGQRAARPLQAGLRSRTPVAARTVEDAVDDWRSNPRGRLWPAAVAGEPEGERVCLPS